MVPSSRSPLRLNGLPGLSETGGDKEETRRDRERLK